MVIGKDSSGRSHAKDYLWGPGCMRMRNVPLIALALGALLLNASVPAQAGATAYQEACLVQEGRVNTSQRASLTPPSENCAQVVVVADIVSCHRMLGQFNCEVSFTATMSVSGLAACGDLAGVVSIGDLCPALVTGSDTRTTTSHYTLPPNGGTIREDFELCVSIRGLSPELLGGVSQKCVPFQLAAFVAPNAQFTQSTCWPTLSCLPGELANVVSYMEPTLEYPLAAASANLGNVVSIGVGVLP